MSGATTTLGHVTERDVSDGFGERDPGRRSAAREHPPERGHDVGTSSTGKAAILRALPARRER
jgi:hypothetical protein